MMLKNIRFTCRLQQEDDVVVAVCPEFNVSSYGDNPDEAVASLYEAMGLFFKECERMGTLETVLEEAGYRQAPTRRRQPPVRKWMPPKLLGTSRLEVSFA
jgi:predicted RNase H-like HicB family nuclease